MADENEVGELPAEDKAYFESRGEKMPQEKPDKVEKPDEKEAKAETEAETDGLLDDEVKPDKTVPLRALTKEREEGKKARLALQEAEKRAAILEDRWNTILALNEKQPETKVDEDPEPDPNQDIFAHNAWLKRQVDAVRTQAAERDKSEKAAKEETAREAAVWNYWGESSKAAAAENPDFQDAVKWMSETRTKQLSALKGLHPQFQSQAGIDQQINTELKQIVIAAAQQGINAGTVVYNMAKEWGYTGPKPADVLDPKPDTAELEKLNKDMEAETSLSSAGGSRPGGALDAKAIADMSPDDFERWYTKNGAAAFKRLQTRGTA